MKIKLSILQNGAGLSIVRTKQATCVLLPDMETHFPFLDFFLMICVSLEKSKLNLILSREKSAKSYVLCRISLLRWFTIQTNGGRVEITLSFASLRKGVCYLSLKLGHYTEQYVLEIREDCVL